MKKINKIKEALSKLIAETFERVSTDKGILSYDAEELEVGVSVSLVDEEGNEVAASDGDYVLEDGRILKIAEGKIAEIVKPEPEAEEPAAEESPERERFMKQKGEFEESYDEKTCKIAEAIRSLGFDAWVVEAADDYAVVEVWADGSVKDYRFAISWDEEGNPVVGEMTEVEQKYVPVEEEKPAEPVVEEVVEEAPAEEAFEEVENPSNEGEETETEAVVKLREEVNELYSLVDALTKRIEELEKKPAAEPASEEFRKAKTDKFSAAKDAHSSFLADLMKA